MKKSFHFRRIHDHIDQELSRIQSQYVIVAAIIEATKAEVANGTYKHVGIRIHDGKVVIPDTLPPDMIKGLYARRNRNGIIWIMRNLPKVTKTYWWESPNFGDPSKGYHSNYRDIDVYQRRLEPPRDWEINLSIISEDESRIDGGVG